MNREVCGQCGHPTGGARDLRDVLLRNGFVPCDIAACNCGSWHHRFGYPERFREIEELLQDNDISTNGVTLLSAIKALVEERNRLRAVNAEQAAWIDTAVANCAKRECSKRDEQLRDLRDELAAAQRQRDDACVAWSAEAAKCRDLTIELAAAQKDAERYRWLRGVCGIKTAAGELAIVFWGGLDCWNDIDEAIDAAMQEKRDERR